MAAAVAQDSPPAMAAPVRRKSPPSPGAAALSPRLRWSAGAVRRLREGHGAHGFRRGWRVRARLGRRPGHPLRPPIVGASRRARRRHQLPPPHKAADLLRDGVHAAGRDRGERWAGGQRTVSAAPEACHPAPVGRRDRSFALSRACCGLRRWTTPGALFSPRCQPAPSTHRPSCAQVGPRRGAYDLPPAPPPPAVGSRAQGERGVSVYRPPST